MHGQQKIQLLIAQICFVSVDLSTKKLWRYLFSLFICLVHTNKEQGVEMDVREKFLLYIHKDIQNNSNLTHLCKDCYTTLALHN